MINVTQNNGEQIVDFATIRVILIGKRSAIIPLHNQDTSEFDKKC